ncbi:metal tolerance protein 6-like isoform X2 [Pomacea canaliculata]|nr:metal tolerance protein 6-like isoform X2 [Pomacea canaliculata]
MEMYKCAHTRSKSASGDTPYIDDRKSKYLRQQKYKMSSKKVALEDELEVRSCLKQQDQDENASRASSRLQGDVDGVGIHSRCSRIGFHSSPGSKSASRESICMMEVAPPNSSLTERPWKLSLLEFSQKRESFLVSSEEVKNLPRNVRKYYRQQSELIKEYEGLEERVEMEGQTSSTDHKIPLRLSQLSFAVNFVLLIAKTVAVALSGSISIISSLVDSSVDLLSGIIIWYTSRAVKRSDMYLYPSGRRRLEPVAIVILSVIMSLASFQLIIESIQKIAAFVADKSGKPDFSIPTIVITASTIGAKLCLYLVCYWMRRKHQFQSSSVDVLMQDHRNDTVSNSVALVFGFLGSQQFAEITREENVVFIDPIGAAIIGIYILVGWWQTGSEQIKLLTGFTAKPEFMSKITWMCLNHSPHILKIDTVRAFHFGTCFLVEVDIVLPKDMTLEATHEVGESLQRRLEGLTEVERAFVHVDWETEHRPEEEHRIS